MSERFECILDPCNRYVIWDNKLEIPVLHHGRMLTYARYAQGQRIAAVINAAAPPAFLRIVGSKHSKVVSLLQDEDRRDLAGLAGAGR